MYYRKLLWHHTPITDFWRVGKGYATKLEKHGMLTMGDVARTSINNEDLLYKILGINNGSKPSTTDVDKRYNDFIRQTELFLEKVDPQGQEKIRQFLEKLKDLYNSYKERMQENGERF